MKRAWLSPLRSRLDERGQVLVFAVLSMVVLLGMAALAVDMGMLLGERTKLQAVADASALAAAQDLPDEPTVKTTAVSYADLNHPGHGLLVDPGEVKIGHWNGSARRFTPDSSPINAVEVYVRRNQKRGNAVKLIFARVLGWDQMDVGAHAIATGGSEGVVSRYILDEDMFDSDVAAIEEIARPLKRAKKIGNKEDVIKDLDGDWIIDLHKYVTPYGTCPRCSLTNATTLELPTGQLEDEAIFDTQHPDVPFKAGAEPCSQATIPASGEHPCSFTDFMNYNEDSNSWRYDLIPKEWLDPLLGVFPANQLNEEPYSGPFPMPCEASVVYKADVSDLGRVGGSPAVDLAPAANALGWRRGIVFFRIVGLGTDPDGPSGSVLPNLLIQICGKTPITAVQGLPLRLVD